MDGEQAMDGEEGLFGTEAVVLTSGLSGPGETKFGDVKEIDGLLEAHNNFSPLGHFYQIRFHEQPGAPSSRTAFIRS